MGWVIRVIPFLIPCLSHQQVGYVSGGARVVLHSPTLHVLRKKCSEGAQSASNVDGVPKPLNWVGLKKPNQQEAGHFVPKKFQK